MLENKKVKKVWFAEARIWCNIDERLSTPSPKIPGLAILALPAT